MKKFSSRNKTLEPAYSIHLSFELQNRRKNHRRQRKHQCGKERLVVIDDIGHLVHARPAGCSSPVFRLRSKLGKLLLETPGINLRHLIQGCKMIKKVAGGYKVLSENGKKNLGGPYKTKKEAEKRLKQVEFFKHRKG